MKQSHSQQSGFTLVELAIVLMIIGLLIGGVLRGQELMQNARISSTIQQVKAYQAALLTFRDSYNALPGDMMFVQQRLPGCTAANQCVDGNGDGIVGISTEYPWNSGIANTVTLENAQFWKQLATVHLISGIDPSATAPEWGKSHPVSKMGPGFFVEYAHFGPNVHNEPATGQGMTAMILLLRRSIDGVWDCGGGPVGGGTNSLCAISPQRASQLDRKMDDGLSVAGDVFSVSGNWNTGCGDPNFGVNGPNGYAENISENRCDMMIKL